MKLYEALNESANHIESLISCWDKSDKIRYEKFIENLGNMTSSTNYRIMVLYIPSVLDLLEEAGIIGLANKSEIEILKSSISIHFK